MVDRVAPVAVVRVNRPSARNALSNELLTELAETLEELEREGMRCVVITGTDRVLADGAGVRAPAEAALLEHYFGPRGRSWERMARLRTPLVAAVAGYCLEEASN